MIYIRRLQSTFSVKTVDRSSVTDSISKISGQIDLIEKLFSMFTKEEWEINRATLQKESEFFSLRLFSLKELKEKEKNLREKETILLKTENILLQENLLKQETKKTAASIGKNHA